MTTEEAERQLGAYLLECQSLGVAWHSVRLDELATVRAILLLERRDRADVALAGIRSFSDETEMGQAMFLQQIVMRLLRAKLPFTDAELVGAVGVCSELPRFPGMCFPLTGLVRTVDGHIVEHGRSLPMFAALRRLLAWCPTIPTDAQTRKAMLRIGGLLQTPGMALEADPTELPIEPGIPWGTAARRELGALPPGEQTRWAALLQHAVTAKGKSKPSKRWLSVMAPLVKAVGRDPLTVHLERWFTSMGLGIRPDEPRYLGMEGVPDGPTDRNLDILKGLIWAVGPLADDRVALAVGHFAVRCFEKIPSYGPGSPRLGNAAVWSLAQMPEMRGVPALLVLFDTVAHKRSKKAIDKALDGIAVAHGVGRDDLVARATAERQPEGTAPRSMDVQVADVEQGLDDTLAALDNGLMELALQTLIQTWRLCRSEDIGNQVDALSAVLARKVPPLPKKRLPSHWTDLLAEDRVADGQRLLSLLFEGTKAQCRKRLDALLERPPDPRTTAPMAAWLKQPTVSLVLAALGHTQGPPGKVWVGLLRLAVHTNDPRMARVLRQVRDASQAEMDRVGDARSPYASERLRRIDRVLPKFTPGGSQRVPEALRERIALLARGLPLPLDVVRPPRT